MFGLMALLAVLGVGIGLAYRRFRMEDSPVNRLGRAAFPRWSAVRIAALAAVDWPARAAGLWRDRILTPYPGVWKWMAAAFGGSFFLLAATGLGFAVLGVRLQGLPLMGHVVLGGFFSPTLAAVLLRRARAYSPTDGEREGRPLGLVTGLFWLFALCAWLLMVTALAMMLPVSSFRAQLNLFALHRWAALASVLCAMVFLEVTAAGSPHDE